MQGRMKALIKTKAGPGAELEMVDIPRIGDGDVLVKVQAAALCGTDRAIYQWNTWAQSRIHPPLILGHEMAGTIVEIGKAVTDLKPGDFVSAETHLVCGHCTQCLHNQYHICGNLRILGVDTQGVFSEYVALPAVNAWKNDPNMSVEVAAIQEPMGNGVYTALSGEIAGKTVAVIGCGPIGVGAIAVCKAAGAKTIFATDISDYRLAMAQRLGAHVILNPQRDDVVKTIREATNGVGVDVILEMSGHPDAIAQGFEALRKGGRASLLGLTSGPMQVDLNNWIIFKGATVYGINGREMFRTWHQMAALQASGLVDFSPIITHRFPLERFREAFELQASGQCGKIILTIA